MNNNNKKYINELKHSFLIDFNNAKKQYEAEIKQSKAFLTDTNGRIIVNVCIN